MIITDTREQKPLFSGKGVFKTFLEVGDYTTMDLMNVFHVERKSMEDLYGSNHQGYVRFRKEFIRAINMGIQLVVYVEGTRANYVAKNFPGGSYRKAPSTQLDEQINTITKKYGIEFVWCGNRANTKRLVEERLIKEEKKFKRSQNKKGANKSKR